MEFVLSTLERVALNLPALRRTGYLFYRSFGAGQIRTMVDQYVLARRASCEGWKAERHRGDGLSGIGAIPLPMVPFTDAPPCA